MFWHSYKSSMFFSIILEFPLPISQCCVFNQGNFICDSKKAQEFQSRAFMTFQHFKKKFIKWQKKRQNLRKTLKNQFKEQQQ